MSSVVSSRPATLASPTAARLASAGPIAVLLIIVALHAIKPDLEPSWRFISEYATGAHAWIMQLAFLVWATSCGALAVALRSEVRSRVGRAGVVVLFVVSLALVVAGLFSQDPVTTKPEDGTTSGMLHAIASMIGVATYLAWQLVVARRLGGAASESDRYAASR